MQTNSGTLTLPSEDTENAADRLIPLSIWGWKHDVFVSTWSALGHGFFLIRYTNNKSGKSRSWRHTIVREGEADGYWDNAVRDTRPAWTIVGEVYKGKTGGNTSFRVWVPNVDDPTRLNSGSWAWIARAVFSDQQKAIRMMIAMTEVMHDVSFDRNAVGEGSQPPHA